MPRRVVVVGAGVVGLSCAWFLQKHGAEVTVLERSEVGAGASWGNAGYLVPAMVAPLAEPALLREGVRSLLTPGSPVSVSARLSAATMAFLTGFARNATAARWRRGMAALGPLAARSLSAFDELAKGGVAAEIHEQTIRIGFTAGQDTAGLEHELALARASGQEMSYRTTTGHEAPFSGRIAQVLHLEGQRFLAPGTFLDALAASVRERGGEIVEGARVRAIGFGPRGLQADTWAGPPHRADAVVLATGAWLPELGRRSGVRMPVQAGRGYSCSVRLAEPLAGPVYLPGARATLTPYGDRVRITGVMEIAARDAPFDGSRLDAVLRSIRPLLDADWDDVREPWSGSRPLTPCGLPVIGAAKIPGVQVAGGHGMWGLTLGPITGKLLARQIMTGAGAPELVPFDPLRRS
ncbi:MULTISPECIES: NAD(P)/FAD-dependent oxidoreductase [Amycolatopsis]|uniref:FAD-binding oxidoreductase n=1 Tax=Amycolatopsis dendrobii TaxID=2760662 RepID=A0A7W3Z8B6_9PSEU|nr:MULTISPECIES: FAD-dependent oxidoreductase [Amycolatopsis]MBB1152216.1 FAD-binding oxidoreductase [Amycolatopsis dendrobii]UKD59658.1 FAD-binding oxidoreductase [Amycolatopsis sp. FU40]